MSMSKSRRVDSAASLLHHCCWLNSIEPLAPPSLSSERRLQRQWCRQLQEGAISRYQSLSFREESALVDELLELSGYHRKSVLRLLSQGPVVHGAPPARDGLDSAVAVGRRRRCGLV